MRFLIFLFFSFLSLFAWFVLDNPKSSENNSFESVPQVVENSSRNNAKTVSSAKIADKKNNSDLKVGRSIAANLSQNPEDISDSVVYQSPSKEKFAECRDGDRVACKALSGLCQERDFDACYYIGQVLGRANLEKATKYYKFACDQISHANSCYELALTMQTSRNETDIENANSYFHLACFEGNAEACLKLAATAPDPEQRELYLAEASRVQGIKDSREY